jgi:transposase
MLNMMQYTHFIGIDVSKDTLDICILFEKAPLWEAKITNDKKAFGKVKKQLKLLKVNLAETLWCMEHTGIYSNLILYSLNENNASVWLESPLQIKLSQGVTREKNDKIDALRIAIYASTFCFKAKLWQPKRPVIQNLKQLMRMRGQLLHAKVSITKTIAEAKRFMPKETTRLIVESTKKSLIALTIEVQAIEIKMQETIKEDDYLNHLFKLVTSVDGVGLQTAAIMLITTNEFKDFNCPKKYACYAGVAPFKQQSGKSLMSKSRVSDKANKEVKKMLHMAALTVLKIPNSEYILYYQRKKLEAKNGMTIINAIRAKLISRVFACVRDQRVYEKKYVYNSLVLP